MLTARNTSPQKSQWGGAARELEGLTELRGKVVQLFVKHLSGSNETAIGLAHAGLVAIMQHQRMIKAVLQARARPVKHAASGSLWHSVCTLRELRAVVRDRR